MGGGASAGSMNHGTGFGFWLLEGIEDKDRFAELHSDIVRYFPTENRKDCITVSGFGVLGRTRWTLVKVKRQAADMPRVSLAFLTPGITARS